ncbi:MAG: C4-dicarboxylate ABC transporter substrate-binding protein, partial [Deltaproteobacteria bacterium]|nr:C4-dicarboxylate ABC transporter substrate-binding protein [Deltaproteobacteria bacterium]
FTRDDVPEELVYQFTKAFWNNLSEVQKDPSFKILKKEYALVMSEMPLHPGARRYFKEVGMLK